MISRRPDSSTALIVVSTGVHSSPDHLREAMNSQDHEAATRAACLPRTPDTLTTGSTNKKENALTILYWQQARVVAMAGEVLASVQAGFKLLTL